MRFLGNLFRKKQAEKQSSPAKVQQPSRADYSFVRDGKGNVVGMWLRDPELAQDSFTLMALLSKHQQLSGGLLNAVTTQQYRVVSNTFDDAGGCFLMFGTSPAPGEQASPPPFQILDLRSEDEKQIEREAQMDLGGEDEQFARRLCSLQYQRDARGNTTPTAHAEIRKIGEYLGANGGDKRMRRIAYRVQTLGGSARELEWDWEDICGWTP